MGSSDIAVIFLRERERERQREREGHVLSESDQVSKWVRECVREKREI